MAYKVGKYHPPIETRFKPGQSGNSKGRPKGSKNFSTLLKIAYKSVAKDLRLGQDPDKLQIEILKVGIKQALKGKFPFWREILDRVYGKVPEKIEKEEIIPSIELKDI